MAAVALPLDSSHRVQISAAPVNMGEAYTLRFGPPVQFVTPNLADIKRPLILIVQGEQYNFDSDLTEAEQATFS